MRWNALQNKVTHKTKLCDLGHIEVNNDIAGIAEVKNGKITIKQVELNRKETRLLEMPVVINTDLEDGKYSVLSLMGRHCAILEDVNEHPDYMCHYWYEKRKEDAIKPVDNANVRLLTRGKKAKDVTESLIGNQLVLKTVPEKGYANIYKDEEMICSIAPDFIAKRGIKMGMNGWKVIFSSVTVPTDETKKSFNATLSICEG